MMSNKQEPYVSIVTPVYNGGKYLAECIESVLAQTYQNWEYVIVNNCSTDNTLSIAEQFASRDKRITVYSNENLLPVIQNWNKALSYISSGSKYCKQIHADDILLPECISKMVDLAERDDLIAMVGSYRIAYNRTECGGLEYPQEVFDGREVCRRVLSENTFRVFGSPSTVLIRSNIIHDVGAFYDEKSVLSQDLESGLKYLKDKKWGYIHQILSVTRVHSEQVSSFVRTFRIWELDYLMLLNRYGVVYLTGEEFRKRIKKVTTNYYFNTAKTLLTFEEKSRFVKYHQETMQKFGVEFSYLRLIGAYLKSFFNNVLNPIGLLKNLIKK